MDMDDDILSKAPVRSVSSPSVTLLSSPDLLTHPTDPHRNLRGRLYRESYEFVRSQRIACLHEGAWFRSPRAPIPTSSRKPATVAQKAWRFYRLAANRRVLHFVETSERIPIRPGLDDLPERSESLPPPVQ